MGNAGGLLTKTESWELHGFDVLRCRGAGFGFFYTFIFDAAFFIVLIRLQIQCASGLLPHNSPGNKRPKKKKL